MEVNLVYRFSKVPQCLMYERKFFKEKNDCSVVALAIVMGSTYSKAHAHLKSNCGRVCGMGFMSRKFLPNSFKNTNVKVLGLPKGVTTLNKFCKDNPKGRFYVCVRGHALAVVDGCVYDFQDKPRRHVTWALKIND